MANRFFTNDMKDEPADIPQDFLSRCANFIPRILKDIEGKSDRSPSIYTGTGGLALLYLKLSETTHAQNALSEKGKRHHSNSEFQKWALSLLCDGEAAFGERRTVSFLEGLAGNITLQAIALLSAGREEEAERRCCHLLQISKHVNSLPPKECEILYGRAGFLYCIALIRGFTGDTTFGGGEAQRIIADILLEGRRGGRSTHDSSVLLFEWHKSSYLGAAHGIAGILLVLLHLKDDLAAAESFAGLPCGNAMESIEHTVDFVFRRCEFPSGNIRSSLHSESDRLVHWCHGAPGFIPLIAKCAEVFDSRREHYLRALTVLGEVVWTRGLLRKGLGLCHGIGGNGLTLLCLYRATNNSLWLRRAQQFAMFGMHHYNELLDAPDRPLSLFEGVAGFAVFLNGFFEPKSSVFPGYEILQR